VRENKLVRVSNKYFALVAKNPKSGDDINISFHIGERIATKIDKAPRLAVYDKKLLWRANLYIDEGAGNADWNNRHPWVTGNEWNRTRNINPGDWNAILDDWTSTGESPITYGSAHVLEKLYPNEKVLPVGNGGQVVKYLPWVLFTQGGVNVNNSVAYGWGAQDSPFEFDQEVLQQKARILERRTLDSNDGDSATKYGSLPWNNSYGAPANIWDYYIFPIRHLSIRARLIAQIDRISTTMEAILRHLCRQIIPKHNTSTIFRPEAQSAFLVSPPTLPIRRMQIEHPATRKQIRSA
jgi:hypothetical protein